MSVLSAPNGGAQASASPQPASTPEPESQETKPLTIEDVKRVAEEIATRTAQSFVDKAENRISTKAQAQIEALKATQGATGLTEEQLQQAISKIVIGDFTQPPAEPASPAQQPPSPSPAAIEDDPVIAEIMDIFKTEGIELDPADPEFPPIDAVLRDPNGNIHVLRKELFKQIDIKRQRLALQTEQAEARVISSGASNTGEAAVSNAHSLWSRAHDTE